MSALINALSAEGYAVVLTSGPDAREKKMVDVHHRRLPAGATILSRPVNAAPAARR